MTAPADGAGPSPRTRPHVRLLAGVLLLTAAASAQRYLNGWALDDARMVFAERVHDLSNAFALFRHNALWIVGVDGNAIDTYRPLSILTFLIDHAIGGATPWIHHTTNLLLHLAATALVFGLGRRLSRDTTSAALVACFFGLNAGTAEAHVWINGRSDALMTALALAFVALWLRWRARARSAARDAAMGVGLTVLFLAACLSKEVCFLIVPALPLLERADLRAAAPPDGGRRRSMLVGLLPALGGAGLYLAARSAALSGMGAGGGTTAWGDVLRTAAIVWWDGLLTIFVPTRQAMRMLAADYAALPGWTFGLAWAGALALAATLPWAARRAPSAAAALVIHAATLAPVALLAHTTWPGMARYTYLAAAFWAIALARPLAHARARHRATGWIVALVLALHGLLLQAHISVYRNETTFAEAMLQENPRALHGHLMLAQHAMDHGAPERAATHFEAALATGWPACKAWDGLLIARLLSGTWEQGVAHVPAAEAACPGNPRVLNSSGLLLEAAGRHAEACARWARCACGSGPHDRTFCERNLERSSERCNVSQSWSEAGCTAP